MPVRRERIYLPSWSMQLLADRNVSPTVPVETFHTSMEVLGREHPVSDINTFLVSETHPSVLRGRIQARSTSSRQSLKRKKSDPDAGVAMWMQRQKPTDTASNLHDGLSDRYPEIALLGPRRKAVLDSSGIMHPHPFPVLVELSQTNPNGARRGGISPCVTPHNYIWVGHRVRRLKACECLGLQGISVPDDIMAKVGYDNPIVRDMAGNAFNLVCFQACLVSWLVGLGAILSGGHHHASQRNCVPMPLCENVDAESDSDDSSVNWSKS